MSRMATSLRFLDSKECHSKRSVRCSKVRRSKRLPDIRHRSMVERQDWWRDNLHSHPVRSLDYRLVRRNPGLKGCYRHWSQHQLMDRNRSMGMTDTNRPLMVLACSRLMVSRSSIPCPRLVVSHRIQEGSCNSMEAGRNLSRLRNSEVSYTTPGYCIPCLHMLLKGRNSARRTSRRCRIRHIHSFPLWRLIAVQILSMVAGENLAARQATSWVEFSSTRQGLASRRRFCIQQETLRRRQARRPQRIGFVLC